MIYIILIEINSQGHQMKIYQTINKIQAALAKVGIAKDSRNQQQNYNFRGIDAVYNALAPLLAEHGLCILPEVLERTVTERTTAKGGLLIYVVVKVCFKFVASEDNSGHTVTVYGEGMDSGDKATNKALSAAYKYACMQAFCIPTEGDNDADAHTHEVIAPKVLTVSKFDELVTAITFKRIGSEQCREWCKQYGVDRLRELSDSAIDEILTLLKGA